ncbi:hypothetical protein F9Z84_07460 [Escherichia coli]|jgi:hypothetical protein|nr:hypothetical protein F9Z84_07460 [Escherichia coli]
MAWLKRSYKRDWIQRSPKLNTVSFRHELSNSTRWELKPESENVPEKDRRWSTDYTPVEFINPIFELTFSIGSEIIKLHANDNIGASDALRDYVKKLGVIRDVLNRFLREYKPHYEAGKVFVLKEFLNSSTGPSAVYTSMVAVGTSVTHDFFFDIASCTDKARLYEYKEKNFIEVLVKLTKFITTAITDAESTLDKYKGRL